MADSGLVTVSSPIHRKTLICGLWQQFISQQGLDVLFKWSGRSIRANRLVADVFLPANRLRELQEWEAINNEDKQKLVEKSPEDGTIIDSLLEFLYNGHVVVRLHHLDKLLILANQLGFASLTVAAKLAKTIAELSVAIQPDADVSLVTVSCTTHQETLVHGLWQLFLDKRGVDYDVVWCGQSVRAHRLILDVFLPPDVMNEPNTKCLASSNPLENESSPLKSLVEFMYNGEVCVHAERLNDLHLVATALRFHLLVDAVEVTKSRMPILPLPQFIGVQICAETMEVSESDNENGAIHKIGNNCAGAESDDQMTTVSESEDPMRAVAKNDDRLTTVTENNELSVAGFNSNVQVMIAAENLQEIIPNAENVRQFAFTVINSKNDDCNNEMAMAFKNTQMIELGNKITVACGNMDDETMVTSDNGKQMLLKCDVVKQNKKLSGRTDLVSSNGDPSDNLLQLSENDVETDLSLNDISYELETDGEEAPSGVYWNVPTVMFDLTDNGSAPLQDNKPELVKTLAEASGNVVTVGGSLKASVQDAGGNAQQKGCKIGSATNIKKIIVNSASTVPVTQEQPKHRPSGIGGNWLSKSNPRFKCLECGTIFNDNTTLSEHTQLKHPTFKCLECSTIFNTKTTLSEHTQLKHPKFKCLECCTFFNDKIALSEHTQLKHPKFKCLDCCTIFNDQTAFSEHIQLKHPKFKCLECRAMFNDKNNLSEHMQLKHLSKVYVKSEQYNEPGPSFGCLKCGLTFREDRLLTEHQLSDHCESIEISGMIAPNPNFICFFCCVAFRSEKILAEHKRFKHSGTFAVGTSRLDDIKSNIKCLVCGLIFKHKKQLFQHKLQKHPSPETQNSASDAEFQRVTSPRIQCLECRRVFASENHLKQHNRFKHRTRTTGTTTNKSRMACHIPVDQPHPPTTSCSSARHKKPIVLKDMKMTLVDSRIVDKVFRCRLCKHHAKSMNMLQLHHARWHFPVIKLVKCDLTNRGISKKAMKTASKTSATVKCFVNVKSKQIQKLTPPSTTPPKNLNRAIKCNALTPDIESVRPGKSNYENIKGKEKERSCAELNSKQINTKHKVKSSNKCIKNNGKNFHSESPIKIPQRSYSFRSANTSKLEGCTVSLAPEHVLSKDKSKIQQEFNSAIEAPRSYSFRNANSSKLEGHTVGLAAECVLPKNKFKMQQEFNSAMEVPFQIPTRSHSVKIGHMQNQKCDIEILPIKCKRNAYFRDKTTDEGNKDRSSSKVLRHNCVSASKIIAPKRGDGQQMVKQLEGHKTKTPSDLEILTSKMSVRASRSRCDQLENRVASGSGHVQKVGPSKAIVVRRCRMCKFVTESERLFQIHVTVHRPIVRLLRCDKSLKAVVKTEPGLDRRSVPIRHNSSVYNKRLEARIKLEPISVSRSANSIGNINLNHRSRRGGVDAISKTPCARKVRGGDITGHNIQVSRTVYTRNARKCTISSEQNVIRIKQNSLPVPESDVTSAPRETRSCRKRNPLKPGLLARLKFFRCLRCGGAYLSQQSRDRHICKSRTLAKVARCSDCDYAARHHRDLNIHRAVHDPSIRVLFCPTCAKPFSSIDRHVCKSKKSFPPKKKAKKMRCTLCDYKTADVRRYHLHLAEHDSSIRIFRCVRCTKPFLDVASLHQHSCKKRRLRHCERCDFSSYRKRELNAHVMTVHNLKV